MTNRLELDATPEQLKHREEIMADAEQCARKALSDLNGFPPNLQDAKAVLIVKVALLEFAKLRWASFFKENKTDGSKTV